MPPTLRLACRAVCCFDLVELRSSYVVACTMQNHEPLPLFVELNCASVLTGRKKWFQRIVPDFELSCTAGSLPLC
uniref:Uncharacterized protein n=1 Tax=Arundo donax TaxID=35708 RepID=A0A0A9HCW8_ARUDO